MLNDVRALILANSRSSQIASRRSVAGVWGHETAGDGGRSSSRRGGGCGGGANSFIDTVSRDAPEPPRERAISAAMYASIVGSLIASAAASVASTASEVESTGNPSPAAASSNDVAVSKRSATRDSGPSPTASFNAPGLITMVLSEHSLCSVPSHRWADASLSEFVMIEPPVKSAPPRRLPTRSHLPASIRSFDNQPQDGPANRYWPARLLPIGKN